MMRRNICVALLLAACLAASAQEDRGLDSFIQNMAESAGELIRSSGSKAVAVVELGTPKGTTGGSIGTLGKYIATCLQSRLVALPGRGYQVVDRMNLERVLKEQELQLSGIVDDRKTVQLGMILSCDSLLTGSVEDLKSLVLVNLNLLDVEKGNVLGSVTKRIPYSSDVKALLGMDFEDAAIVKEIAPPKVDFPYYVRVIGADGSKKEYYAGGKRYILAKPGEQYAIEIENRTNKAVGVALFIDGVNSAFMKRELPARATKWIVYANQTAVIQGWQADSATARKFVFSGKEDSLASKMGFSDEVGLICAAFFNQQDSLTRGAQEAGTKAGDAFGAPVKMVDIRLEKTPAVVLNIWYDYEHGLAARGIAP
jgi:hypothetical protein